MPSLRPLARCVYPIVLVGNVVIVAQHVPPIRQEVLGATVKAKRIISQAEARQFQCHGFVLRRHSKTHMADLLRNIPIYFVRGTAE